MATRTVDGQTYIYASVGDVLDRLHAINGTLTGINALRYFPEKVTGFMPCIVPVFGTGTHTTDAYGVENVRTTRTYLLILYIRPFTQGVPTKTAQVESEALIDNVIFTYWQRPLLEAGDPPTPLDGIMEDVRITQDSGLVSERADEGGIATVRFTLTVETEQTIRRL